MVSALAVGGCSSSTASAPSLTDVTALLAAHGRAVLAHDRTAFLAGIDDEAKAATFRAGQRAAFANLVELPLTSWRYTVESRTDDRGFEQAATKTFGRPAIIVRIALSYALRGVDRIPTSHEVWWTFVRRDGHVVIAADDGLAQAGGVSWRGPWDFGPLDVVRGPHSIVIGHAGDAGTLHTVAATTEAAIPAVTAVWGSGWAQDVAVVVPATADELAAQVGESSSISTAIAAVAVSDGVDPLTGFARGQRLIINPAALQRLSAVGRQITIRHEVTHIADAEATTAATPRWLAEGFADYVGNLNSGQPVGTAASELRTDVRKGRLPAALPSEAAFDTEGQAAPAYEQSWLACRLIAQRAGPAGLVRFYRQVGAAPIDADTAVAAVFRRILHEIERAVRRAVAGLPDGRAAMTASFARRTLIVTNDFPPAPGRHPVVRARAGGPPARRFGRGLRLGPRRFGRVRRRAAVPGVAAPHRAAAADPGGPAPDRGGAATISAAPRSGSAPPPRSACSLRRCARPAPSASWRRRTGTRPAGRCCPVRGRRCAGSAPAVTSSPISASTSGAASPARSAGRPNSSSSPQAWTSTRSVPTSTARPSAPGTGWPAAR